MEARVLFSFDCIESGEAWLAECPITPLSLDWFFLASFFSSSALVESMKLLGGGIGTRRLKGFVFRPVPAPGPAILGPLIPAREDCDD